MCWSVAAWAAHSDRWRVERVEATTGTGCYCSPFLVCDQNTEQVASSTITVAIVIAAGLTHHPKLSGAEHGLHKVAEVLYGCLVGLLVTWLMSKLWPIAAARHEPK
jgi:hypothetical protein